MMRLYKKGFAENSVLIRQVIFASRMAQTMGWEVFTYTFMSQMLTHQKHQPHTEEIISSVMRVCQVAEVT